MKMRIFVAFLMLIAVLSPTVAYRECVAPEFERAGIVLSELSGEECRAFLAETGLQLLQESASPYLEEQIELFQSAVAKYDGEILQMLVARAEKRPEHEVGFNGSSWANNKGEVIRMVVNAYYGKSDIEYCFTTDEGQAAFYIL